MSDNRVDGEMPQLKQLQERWLRLPLSYRVNALLYFLGACATIFLLSTVLRGGDDNPRQIQVGAGTPTTVTTRPGLSTSAAASPVPSTTLGASSTTGGPTTSQPASTAAGSGGDGGGGGGGGGGGSNTTAPPATSGTTAPSSPPPSDTTAPPTTATTVPPTTTTPGRVCRNSTDPACGQFRWDPPPAGNQPLSIQIATSPAHPRVGQEVTFTVTLHDADRAIGTCAWLDFGDGTSQGACQPPPCPARYGPWDPPGRGPDTQIFTYRHTYLGSGAYIATFFADNRTDCYDPYGEPVTKHAPIVIDPGT
jgi:hypothetical protein